jgi:hypothetical protein
VVFKSHRFTIIPASWESEIGKIMIQGQPDQKYNSISTNKPGIVVHSCNPNFVGDTGRRSKANLRQKAGEPI